MMRQVGQISVGVDNWQLRGGRAHPMKRVNDARFAEVLAVLNQIVQLA